MDIPEESQLKSTHEVDGGNKKTTTTTSSIHAINKSSINSYARPRVKLAESDKAHSESEDEGLIISPNVVFEDGDDHSAAFLGSSENIISRDIVTRLKLTPTKHTKPYKIGWIKAVEEVLNPIRNSWSSSFQEDENDGGIELEKKEKRKFWKK
ncbi:hypothetical protein Tco_1321373 [Tanacetum coccineum]